MHACAHVYIDVPNAYASSICTCAGDEVQDAVTVLITEPEEDVQASKPKRGNGKPKGAKVNGKAKAKGGAAKKKTSVTGTIL